MNVMECAEQTIRGEALLQPGWTIVVAVSGGPDSIALLHVLNRLTSAWRWKLVVAHVNHHFRGEESDREAEFVSNRAKELGLMCEIGYIDVPAYIRAHKQNGQAAARELRYAFLHGAADKHGAHAIALAHHADDQAETVMMRLLRGAGPAGLSGIPIRRPEKNVELVRPFLRIYKEALVAYCTENRLDYCIDTSNLKRSYVRNQIRLDVLPYLSRYNEKFREGLNRLSRLMAEDNAYLDRQTDEAFERLVEKQAGKYIFEIDAFRSLPVALQRRLIKLILSYLSSESDAVWMDFAKTEHVREAVQNDSPAYLQLDLSSDIRFVRSYNRAVFLQPELEREPKDYFLEVDLEAGECPIPGTRFLLCFEADGGAAAKPEQRPESRCEAWFDYDELQLPLIVRNRRPGDRMEVLGLNGSKKVKDMLIDEKVERAERETLPLVTDRTGRILWVSGIRRSRHARVHACTRRVLRIRLHGFGE